MPRALGAGLLVCCVSWTIAGCGTKEMGAKPAHSIPRTTETACMGRGGARIAASPGDIAFFTRDRARGKAEKPGGVFLHRFRVMVEEWRSVPEGSARVPKWALWSAQPVVSGTPQSPERVLAHRAGGYYVAYIYRPRPAQLRAIDRCLEAVAGHRG